MPSLSEILDNIADHTETLFQLIDDGTIAPDVASRLKQHMLLEEKETTAALQERLAGNPSPMIQKLLDHSFFIQRMMQEEEAMSVQLKRELLHHFMEEHRIWMAELSAGSDSRRWTVGPLWRQGG